jgi:hypothetical protein
MRTGFSMKAFAAAALTFAIVGCGGGAGGGGADHGASATSEPLAHADAVNVTYYYLPG